MFHKFKQASATIVLAVCVGIAGIVTTAYASDPIKERQDLMKEIGQELGKLVKILKNEAPFKGADVVAAAQAIESRLGKAEKLFPKGSISDKSYAKPEVWSDNATFMKGFGTARKAAANVVKIGKADDEIEFSDAMNQVFQGCKGCHEKFRKPKEQ